MPHDTRSNCPRRTHGIMARLMRHAAGVLFVALILGAFAASAAGSVSHRCIHDAVQREALNSIAASPQTAATALSPVGLPYVTPGENTVEVRTLASSNAPDVPRTVAWGNFRIATSTLDLTTTGSYCEWVGQNVSNHRGVSVACKAEDILTDKKRSTLLASILPAALGMHTDRLQVKRTKGTWKVTNMSQAVCTDFIIPVQHKTYGVSRTDFMLYVASVPSDADVSAWAITCQVFSNDQPAVGVLNVPAAYITGDHDAQLIHSIAHELAHALGFSSTFFANAGMSSTAAGIRGKTYAAPVINSSSVVAATRAQFGCATATYMELEDMDPTGMTNSHWKQRNAADELMAPVMSVGYYTNITLAAFEDMGFYKPVYSKAEGMTWGRNASCTLLTDKCVVGGVSQFPSMFCAADEKAFRCTAGRLGMGTCVVKTYDTALPPYFQYFTTTTEGGSYGYYDYCPNVVEWSNGSCTQNAATAAGNVTVFNIFSASSRCVDGNFTPKVKAGGMASGYFGMCVQVRCDTQLGTYSIKVHGDNKFRKCTGGQHVTLSSITSDFEKGGYIICPPYTDLCQSNVEAAADYAASVDAAVAPRTATVAILALVLALICA